MYLDDEGEPWVVKPAQERRAAHKEGGEVLPNVVGGGSD